ncbi:MAG: DUF2283 domain-containing protein [Beijerinckiaceae bacterium]|nr:DUF2283 domain-containing protein [Beijerinckiaceae bacterium]
MLRGLKRFQKLGRKARPTKTRFDPDADALSVRFTDDEILEAEEVSPDVIIDFDKDGGIVAVEILHAKSRLPNGIDFAAYWAA